ncbi:MAG: cation:proton antiporter [Betaproteobacteria bacterium]|nr:cation:proton antiporter [Betaproteobacteria bacterium]
MASFLPQYPLPANPLLLFGLLLLAGLAGGELVKRVLNLPRIVGYVLIGLALGASGLNVLDAKLVREAWIFVDIALGLILFELGRRLDFAWLRRDRWLAATGVLESALAFACVFLALLYFDVNPLHAAAAASIAIATSPAVVLVVAQELKAEGQVTERVLILTAMNSIIAFIASTMLLAWLHHEYRANWMTVVLHPLYLLAGSALLGYAASIAAMALARWLGKSGRGHFMMLLALIVVTVGAARMFELSVVLALLAFGVLAKNLDERHDLMPVDVGIIGQLFVVVLFVVSGASLRIGELVTGGTLALVYVLARFAGKSLGVMSLTYLSGVRRGAAGLLCLALVPMSGTAVGMVHRTSLLYPEFGAKLSAIVLSAVLILELIGPVAAQFALKRAGEAAA